MIQNDGFSMWMLYKAVFLESDSESSNSTLCSLRPGKKKETSLFGTEKNIILETWVSLTELAFKP